MIFGGCKEQYFQAIRAAVQFRMFHVLIYNIDIVPVILCGREIWRVMSIEEMKLKATESRVVGRIFDV